MEGPMGIRKHRRRPAAWISGIGFVGLMPCWGAAGAATIVTVGASNTYGKGVSRSEAYPAQLEALLRARGYNIRVVNAGINGDTTASMASRLDTVVPADTSIVILQLGGNDRRKGEGA